MLSNEVNVARLDIVRLNFDSTTRRSASSLQNFSYDISLSRKIQSIRTTKSMFHSFSSFLFPPLLLRLFVFLSYDECNSSKPGESPTKKSRGLSQTS